MKVIKEILLERVSAVRKMPETLLDNRLIRRNQKRFCIALKRKMRAAQMAPALPYIKVELYIEQPKEVAAIRYYGYEKTGFFVCPNCGYAMEREYQKHCEQCGQLLAWNKFNRNEITLQRITGPKIQGENAIRPRKIEKYGSALFDPLSQRRQTEDIQQLV